MPEGFNSSYEVSFGLKVGAPQPCRIYGLKMLDEPFSLRLRDVKPFLWALWCAAHSLYAQDVAVEFYVPLASDACGIRHRLCAGRCARWGSTL